jgi:hypothetical protein
LRLALGLLCGARVPSFRHELLVELFRNRAELACALLNELGVSFDHDRVVLGSVDLSQVAPTTYHADAVVELLNRSGQRVAAVIVEVQLRPDAGKLYTWPHYVAGLHARLKCPVVLLVVAPDPKVAAWARKEITIGPGFSFTPQVIEMTELPRITEIEVAWRLFELAVLSAMAHPEVGVATTAIEAISTLPEAQNRLYFDVVMSALPRLVRQALEAQMEGYEYQSEFARKYYAQGRKEGRKEGREEGVEEGVKKGREKGREEGLQMAVLAMAHAKLRAVTAEDEASVRAMHDADALEALIRELGAARGVVQARRVFNRILGVKPARAAVRSTRKSRK